MPISLRVEGGEDGRTPRSRCFGLSWVALFGLLMATACGPRGLLGNDGGNENAVPTPSSPARLVVETELPTTPARTLKYASLQFKVTKAAITNRPSGGGASSGAAEITLSVSNPLSDAVSIRGALWTLRLGDGTTATAPYAENLEARDTKERTIHFSVPAAATWNGAQLALDENDKEPAVVALDGPAQPGKYPMTLAATGEASTEDPAIAYAISKATLDLDGVGERALAGKRYLNLSVHMADKERDGAQQFVPELFHLTVDGASVAPDEIDNSILSSASAKDVAMSFAIPATVTRVELEVGKVDGETATIPIDLGAGSVQP